MGVVKHKSTYDYQKLLLRMVPIAAMIMTLWILYKEIDRANVCTVDTLPISPKEAQFVFIGGHPRSGTTLMRVILDVHPLIRCGPETMIIPKILEVRKAYTTGHYKKRLEEANLYPSVLNKATESFIKTMIYLAGDQANILCNKDPLALLHIMVLHELFPTAKFVNMIRDGRAVVASMIKRKIMMAPTNLTAEGQLRRWDEITGRIQTQCEELGPTLCWTVRYEDLVLRPNKTMHQVLEFLQVPWDPVVLHHDTLLDHVTSLSKLEPSTSQVKHPIHLEALSSWATNATVLSEEFLLSAHLHSSLLGKFGYANMSIPPNYGQAEPEVLRRNEELKKSEMFRRDFA